MSTFETQEQLLENFELFDDWEDKYSYIIDLGKKLPAMEDALKTDGALVKGCTSKVWLIHTTQDENHHFIADSDAHIVKGILYILLCLFNGKSSSDIQNTSASDFLEKAGMEEALSPNRRNGLTAVEEKIKAYSKL
ncbi:MAG: SufE family protein [Pseudomonadota bacterium]|nr:SufE family protein [Pseudomonadota bacterium]